MKILHVIPALAYGFGGPTQAVLDICKGLVKYGQDVTIFTTNADINKKLDVSLDREFNLDGIKIFYFPVSFLKHYKFSYLFFKNIKKTIKNFEIIHIHSLFQFPSLVSSYYAQRFNLPYIIRPLGQLDPFLLKRHRIRKVLYLNLIERRNLKSASYIHFTSEEERRLALKTGIKFNSFVLPLGIDLERFTSLPAYGSFRQHYPELEGKKIILFLGRISFKKGLDILVEAFYRLCMVRDDLYLVIAGPDDEGYSKIVKRLIKKRNILDRVIFTGMLLGEDKLSVLRDSDIFVLPSYSENFGLAIVEAMACGLPVVISDKVNISSDIKDREAGIVIKPEVSSLYEGLKKALEDDKIFLRIKENSKILVQEKFNIDKIIPNLIDIYKSLIKN
ncbi:MAG: glycosyltransferase [Candidatus Omnitrophica bacterium]|nr:glycosyltransferase [Candidatus Omnitrophota bacterium]